MLTTVLSIFSISALWIYTEIVKANKILSINKENYENDQKTYLKNEVFRVVELINYSRSNNNTKSKQQLQSEVLSYITKVRLEHGGYIFVNTYDGKALVFDGVKIIGEKDITNMTDPDGLRLFDIEMECARNPDGDYFSYKFKRLDSFTPVPKLSYVFGYNDWEWIIGAGIYLDDLETYLLDQKAQSQSLLYRKVLYIILLFFALLLLIFAVTNYLSVFLRNQIAVITSFFTKAKDENSVIDQKDLRILEFKSLAHSVNIMINQRRVAEKSLKKERDKAREYLRIAGVIILALDTEGFVTLINRKGCAILGYREDEIIGKNWFHHFIPISQKQKIFDRFRKIIKSGIDNFSNTENLVITKLGEERNILWQNTLIKDENGQLQGTLSSGLDITERKKVEASYFESEEKYRLLFEKSNDPVLILGEDDIYLDCNKAALNLLGYLEKSQLIGTHPANISPEFQPDGQSSLVKAKKIIDEARLNGTASFEWQHIDIDNKPFFVDIAITEIPISGTKYLYVVWRNISERKKQEKELLIAKEKAEQSDNLKTSFLHNMQHEIRTPLNAIMGFTQILKLQEFSKAERNDYLDDILSSGSQLSNIIDKIIDFARLQSGNVFISNDKLELRKFVCDIYLSYYKQIHNKKVKLSIDMKNNNYTPVIFTDYQKIKEVTGHLLDNAIKFTEEGSIRLSYTIEEHNVIFKVSDSGIGIDEKHYDSVFGKFNKPTPKHDDKIYGGNGLGLSISKAILEHLGGKISIDSKIGEGSTFSFTIPYDPVKPSGYINRKSIDNKVIILVSEKKSFAKRFSKILYPFKLQVKQLYSGMEAVEYFQGNFPANLIILDSGLQQMNSFTTTKAIQAFKKSIPIIAFVNENENKKGLIEESIVSGCLSFICEKDTEEEIIITISHSLS